VYADLSEARFSRTGGPRAVKGGVTVRWRAVKGEGTVWWRAVKGGGTVW